MIFLISEIIVFVSWNAAEGAGWEDPVPGILYALLFWSAWVLYFEPVKHTVRTFKTPTGALGSAEWPVSLWSFMISFFKRQKYQDDFKVGHGKLDKSTQIFLSANVECIVELNAGPKANNQCSWRSLLQCLLDSMCWWDFLQWRDPLIFIHSEMQERLMHK